MIGEERVLDGVLLKPSSRTCNPDVPSQKCKARVEAEARGAMRFNEQARGWEYPVPAVRRPPIQTWEFCPFCLIPLPAAEVPKYARLLPYTPPQQPDNPK